MKFSDWQSTGKEFIHQKRYPIFYQEAGTGTPLVLLHGFPTASWDWHKVWPALAQRYSLIALDFLGFGFSAKPFQHSYRIADQADLIEAFLAAEKITAVHILAHDYGDTVAQELLARMLDRQEKGEEGLVIQSVVLLNGGLFPETHRPRLIQKALISPLGLLVTPFINKKTLRSNFQAIFGPGTPPSEQEIDEFYALMEASRGRYVFHKLIRYMAERRRYRQRWVQALQNSPCPIRLLNGALDPISGQHMAARYRELIPNPDIVSLPTIGHYPQTEAPEATLEHYWAFRDQLPA